MSLFYTSENGKKAMLMEPTCAPEALLEAYKRLQPGVAHLDLSESLLKKAIPDSSLEHLDLKDSPELTEIAGAFSRLEYLIARRSLKLTRVAITGAHRLIYADFRDCGMLKKVSGLASSVRWLYLHKCPSLNDCELPPRLEDLGADGCLVRGRKLPASISYLHLEGTLTTDELDAVLGQLPNLSVLVLENCNGFRSVKALPSAALHLYNCPDVEEIGQLSAGFGSLHTHNCPLLTIPALPPGAFLYQS